MDPMQADEPVEHLVPPLGEKPAESDLPKVIREFLIYAANAKEQEMNLVGEFNSRLFDEAVDMTVHRLRTQIGEDLV